MRRLVGIGCISLGIYASAPAFGTDWTGEGRGWRGDEGEGAKHLCEVTINSDFVAPTAGAVGRFDFATYQERCSLAGRTAWHSNGRQTQHALKLNGQVYHHVSWGDGSFSYAPIGRFTDTELTMDRLGRSALRHHVIKRYKLHVVEGTNLFDATVLEFRRQWIKVDESGAEDVIRTVTATLYR